MSGVPLTAAPDGGIGMPRLLSLNVSSNTSALPNTGSAGRSSCSSMASNLPERRPMTAAAPPPSSQWQDSYARGILDGQVSTRLDQHDAQLATHSALFEKLTELVGALAATQQTLTEARVTDAATRIATADAVKESKDVAEAQAKSNWTPIAKFSTLTASVFGLWILIQVLIPGG